MKLAILKINITVILLHCISSFIHAEDVVLVPESATKRVLIPQSNIGTEWQKGIKLRDLRTVLFNLPKIDLHRHLEGSLRLSTLAEIARQHGVDLPSWDLEELRPYVQVVEKDTPDFHGFLAKFELLRRFYSSREAVWRVAYEAVADAAADNIRTNGAGQ